MAWALPGLGGAAGGPSREGLPPLLPPGALVACCREVTAGWPTMSRTREASLIAMSCWRSFSSLPMAGLAGTAATAAIAPIVELLPGRTPIRYAATPMTTTMAAAIVATGRTTPVLRDARLLPRPRLRCCDKVVLSDGPGPLANHIAERREGPQPVPGKSCVGREKYR